MNNVVSDIGERQSKVKEGLTEGVNNKCDGNED